MKPLLKLSALALLAAASTAAAGEVYGPFFTRYSVDLGALSRTGAPQHETFIPPGGSAPVPFALLTVANSYRGPGTCWSAAATRIGGLAEQKMWIQSTPGTWVSLADDVVNSLDPAAYIYTEYETPTVIRIADYAEYAPGSQGQFQLALTSHFYPHETALQSCDRIANSAGWPYVRISATGAVTLVRRQGSP
jgi:hypothetical protein